MHSILFMLNIFKTSCFPGSENGNSELTFLLGPTGRPSILDTIQNYIPRNREINFHAGVFRIPIRLRLRLTYIRPDRVNDVNSHIILSVALWYGAMYNITRNRDEAAAQ